MATYVNRLLAGNFVLTTEVVRDNGSIALVTVEKHDAGYVYYVKGVDGFKYSNHRAYASSKSAVKASTKTTC